MLELNQCYTTASRSPWKDIPAPYPSRRFCVQKKLGGGAEGIVYQLEEITESGDKPATLACKTPRLKPDAHISIVNEYRVLHHLNGLRAQISGWEEKPPFPMQPEVVPLEVDGDVIPVLLMEEVTPQRFREHYKKRKEQPEVSLRVELIAEKEVWQKATVYLQLLEQLHKADMLIRDRKDNTFVWDEKTQRFVVLDWGGASPDVSEASAVLLFAQNWYELFTGRQRGFQLPDLLNDDAWENLSLAGRSLLIDLHAQRIRGFEGTRQRIREYFTGGFDNEKLSARFTQEQTFWRNHPVSYMPPTEEDKRRYLRALWIADLARRQWSGEQQRPAQVLYDAIRTAYQAAGPSLDSFKIGGRRTLDLPKRVEAAFSQFQAVGKRYGEALVEAAGLIPRAINSGQNIQIADELEKLVKNVSLMYWDWANAHALAEQAAQAKAQLERVSEQIEQAGLGSSDSLAKFARLLNSYDLAARAVISLSHDAVQSVWQEVESWSSEDFRAIGVNKDELLNLGASFKKQDSSTGRSLSPGERDHLVALAQQRRKLIGAFEECIKQSSAHGNRSVEPLRDFRETLNGLMAVPSQADSNQWVVNPNWLGSEWEVLKEYDQVAQQLEIAFLPFLTVTQRVEALQTFEEALKAVPELKAEASQTPLVQDVYRDWQTISPRLQDKKQLKLMDTLDLEQSRLLFEHIGRFLAFLAK